MKGQSRWEMKVMNRRKTMKKNKHLALLRILPGSLRLERKRRKPNQLRMKRLGSGKVWAGFFIAVNYVIFITNLLRSSTSSKNSIVTNVLCFLWAC